MFLMGLMLSATCWQERERHGGWTFAQKQYLPEAPSAVLTRRLRLRLDPRLEHTQKRCNATLNGQIIQSRATYTSYLLPAACYLLPRSYCLPPSAFYLLYSTSYLPLLPSALNLRPSGFYLLPSTSHPLPMIFYLLPSTFDLLRSTFYLLLSIVYIPPATFCLVCSTFYLLCSSLWLPPTSCLPPLYVLSSYMLQLYPFLLRRT